MDLLIGDAIRQTCDINPLVLGERNKFDRKTLNNQPRVLCSFHLATAAKGDPESTWGHQDHCLKDSCVVFNLSPEFVNDLAHIDIASLYVLREDNIHRFINVGNPDVSCRELYSIIIYLFIYLFITWNLRFRYVLLQGHVPHKRQ